MLLSLKLKFQDSQTEEHHSLFTWENTGTEAKLFPSLELAPYKVSPGNDIQMFYEKMPQLFQLKQPSSLPLEIDCHSFQYNCQQVDL